MLHYKYAARNEWIRVLWTVPIVFFILAVGALHAQNLQIAYLVITPEEREFYTLNPTLPTAFSTGETINGPPNRKITVMFVNGDIIRLMPDSTVKIVRFKESNPLKRTFKSEYYLSKGAAVFLTATNNLDAIVETPNILVTNLTGALIAIKITESFTSLTVSMGQPIVANRLHQKQVYPGQHIGEIGYTINFSDDIKLAKRIIRTKSGRVYLEKKTQQQYNLGFSGQLVNRDTNENIPQSFPIFLYSNIYSVQMAKKNRLNARGFVYQDIRIHTIQEEIHQFDSVFFAFLPDDPAHLSAVGLPIYLDVKKPVAP